MEHVDSFYGKQEGERILYKVQTHPMVLLVRLGLVSLAGLTIIILFYVIGGVPLEGGEIVRLMGLVLGIVTWAAGWWGVKTSAKKTCAYITDRRVVRLSAATPWIITSRSLTWDEVVKVKTRSPQLFWQMQNIGSVIIHARSTVVPMGEVAEEQRVTNDDIQIDGIAYYRDLGNYLDKILYLYKRQPEELAALRPFVAKPKGKRY